MLFRSDDLKKEIEAFSIQNAQELEAYRIQYLGTKGLVKSLMGEMKTVPAEDKKAAGQLLNEFKLFAEAKYENAKAGIENIEGEDNHTDFSLPGDQIPTGSRHPISLMRNRIIEIFQRLGFAVAEGPEIEDDWHVFSGLNFPADHPARDMQDTFFVEKNGVNDLLLRTHTSSVQVRAMETKKPPLRIVMPGRVYRNEAISARAHCQFHQIEGLYIDEGVSFADMKQTLAFFTQEFFGKAKIRLRPSYFPFTEPSAEVDVYWGLETEADHRITKGTGWLEIMGCGMVDPAVLEASGIDSKKYSGFAFGMGIERITMLRYQIDDLRHFFENDTRFLQQFIV